MGNNKYFIAKDNLTNYIFILKTQIEVNSDEAIQLLNKVREVFVKRCSGCVNNCNDEKRVALESFKDTIWKMINLGKKYMDTLVLN